MPSLTDIASPESLRRWVESQNVKRLLDGYQALRLQHYESRKGYGDNDEVNSSFTPREDPLEKEFASQGFRLIEQPDGIVRKDGELEKQSIPLVRLQDPLPRSRGRMSSSRGWSLVSCAALDVHVDVALSLKLLIDLGFEMEAYTELRANDSYRDRHTQAIRMNNKFEGSPDRYDASYHRAGMAVDLTAHFSLEHFPHLEDDPHARGKINRNAPLAAGGNHPMVVQYTAPREFFKEYGELFGWYIPSGYPHDWHFQTDAEPRLEEHKNRLLASSVRRSLEELGDLLHSASSTQELAVVLGLSSPLDGYLRAQDVGEQDRLAYFLSGEDNVGLPSQYQEVTAEQRLALAQEEDVEPPDLESALVYNFSTGLWGDGNHGGHV